MANWYADLQGPGFRSLGSATNLSDGKSARVLFCTNDDTLFALHGFVKKTRKTPKPDLELALDRMKELRK
jgi:phage-related protein